MCYLDNCFEQSNSNSTPFSLTQINHREGCSEFFSIEDDWFLPTAISAYRLCPEPQEVIEVQGLLHLRNILKLMDRNTVFRLGLPYSGSETVDYKEHSDDPYERLFDEFFEAELSDYCYTCYQPALICFEVDSSVGSSEAAWKLLCEIDPQLHEVGFLAFPFIEDCDHPPVDSDNYRFYCIANHAIDIPYYSRVFLRRTVNRFGAEVVVSDDGEMSVVSLVKPSAFRADHMIHWNPNFADLNRWTYKNPLKVRSGKVIDIDMFAELTPEEEIASENAISLALDRAIHGKSQDSLSVLLALMRKAETSI